jgi:YegS/Rv2252/BmrU family lipid kinase
VAVIAVVAHARKSLGGGLPVLRRVLADHGCTDPLWYEVTKSRKAPERARRALADGAGLVFIWGGDGMVQRCVDALAGTDAELAIIPAGTANLLATNLGVPNDIEDAVRAGLHGPRRRLDTGSVNGEHFAVMAGAGFDASMIAQADRNLKDRFGRLAYLYTGSRSLGASPVRARIKVDGKSFFDGRLSCVLAGNVGKIIGGIEAFPAASPEGGLLDLGVVTAANRVQWARTFGRLALGSGPESPFVRVTRGSRIRIRFAKPVRYEVDGGARPRVKKLRINVHPASITICVPTEADG